MGAVARNARTCFVELPLSASGLALLESSQIDADELLYQAADAWATWTGSGAVMKW